MEKINYNFNSYEWAKQASERFVKNGSCEVIPYANNISSIAPATGILNFTNDQVRKMSFFIGYITLIKNGFAAGNFALRTLNNDLTQSDFQIAPAAFTAPTTIYIVGLTNITNISDGIISLSGWLCLPKGF